MVDCYGLGWLFILLILSLLTSVRDDAVFGSYFRRAPSPTSFLHIHLVSVLLSSVVLLRSARLGEHFWFPALFLVSFSFGRTPLVFLHACVVNVATSAEFVFVGRASLPDPANT